ncbi:hypothetical protein FNV43_RR04388 [Rhamnella rubrinervis]|uniref:Homeobox domain-containing protein n=1 Tax=Rhamnella rubrinervis TaxID=2594499 RepID=A0A8K0HI32_9ROSA|nr:hypothetical protein FNV43_RR03620 [Rhamnella rubrinervis]KAF3453947.1 hypothetical protein FNV43_RR04388 [Rhamnella rubrinervis]
MILEEMYRAGTRTPNASQIQQITAHLSFYGKIEGKNVFYWFQNHKARDRQKLRRKIYKQLQQQQLFHHHQLNHHFLHSESTSAASPTLHQQLACYTNSTPAHININIPQAGVEEASSQLINYTWKIDQLQERLEMEKTMMRMYGRDNWMMMVDVGPPPSPYCSSSTGTTGRPLKTLELFPITATNLKEECTATSSKHLQNSNPTN